MNRPPFNLAMVEDGTPAALAGGHRIMQTHRYGVTDEEHVAVLASFLHPLPKLTETPFIVDAGCGVGEVSRIMRKWWPHGMFALVNLSALQLSHCPVGPHFMHVLADCHAMPFPDGSADAVMFSSALCQMDAAIALAEARRVLRIGGVLLINEMLLAGGTNAHLLEQHLAARVLDPTSLARLLADNSLRTQRMETPNNDDSHFRGLLRVAGIEAGLEGVKPCVIRAIKTA